MTFYRDIAKTDAVMTNIKEQLADNIYKNGQGIAHYALALKIYNSQGECELTDEEYRLLVNYAEQMCTPIVIDAIKNVTNNDSSKE
jgi:hypothetical protein